jgi:hypothetical protein
MHGGNRYRIQGPARSRVFSRPFGTTQWRIPTQDYVLGYFQASLRDLSQSSRADTSAPVFFLLEIRAEFAMAGAKALTFGPGVARLKSCPDTKQ